MRSDNKREGRSIVIHMLVASTLMTLALALDDSDTVCPNAGRNVEAAETEAWLRSLFRKVEDVGDRDAIARWKASVESMTDVFVASNVDKKERSLESSVRAHYESYPYPPRMHGRHEFGHKALKDCLPSALSDIYFGGDLKGLLATSHAQKLRILIAGGGTGDPTLACARAFLRSGIAADIVHLDLSKSSIDIASSRLQRFRPTWSTANGREGRVNVVFVRGSILDVATWSSYWKGTEARMIFPSDQIVHSDRARSSEGHDTRKLLGNLFGPKFDFIHCTGVLHHSLHRPGLDALRSILRPRGGLHLWVYAREGRAGVMQMREMVRILLKSANVENSTDQQHKLRLSIARALLRSLPPSNALRRNRRLYDAAREWARDSNDVDEPDARASDVRIFDTFLHDQEAHYTASDVVRWIDDAGLRIQEWLDQDFGFYVPKWRRGASESDLTFLSNMLRRVPNVFDRLAFGELLNGVASGHRVAVVMKDNPTRSALQIWSQFRSSRESDDSGTFVRGESILCPAFFEFGESENSGLVDMLLRTVQADELHVLLEDPFVVRILTAFDCTRTVSAVYESIASESAHDTGSELEKAGFDDFVVLVDEIYGLLRQPHIHAMFMRRRGGAAD